MKKNNLLGHVIMIVFGLIGVLFISIFFDCAFSYERKEVFIKNVIIGPGILGVSFEAKGETIIPMLGISFWRFDRMQVGYKMYTARKGRVFYVLEFGIYDQLIMGLGILGLVIISYIGYFKRLKKRRKGFIVGDEIIINEYKNG